MPTYDYTCAACGHRFERFESIHENGPKPCPKCNKKKAKRMLGTGAGLIFKGAGFYTTDSKSKPSSGEKSGGAGGDSEKKSEPKEKKKSEEKESKK
ncbi:MAG TPA: FmdB family zinc ribbon protein [Planctomycetota bacterium]|nr:FmdB family zinc ribbon protein [Planctomycetota bacterium]